MEKTTIGVRNVNEEVFRKFRALAIARRKKLGEALTEAMKGAIKENEFKNGNIMKLAGSWKMSDKEWGRIKGELNKGWKKWKMPSA